MKTHLERVKDRAPSILMTSSPSSIATVGPSDPIQRLPREIACKRLARFALKLDMGAALKHKAAEPIPLGLELPAGSGGSSSTLRASIGSRLGVGELMSVASIYWLNIEIFTWSRSQNFVTRTSDRGASAASGPTITAPRFLACCACRSRMLMSAKNCANPVGRAAGAQSLYLDVLVNNAGIGLGGTYQDKLDELVCHHCGRSHAVTRSKVRRWLRYRELALGV